MTRGRPRTIETNIRGAEEVLALAEITRREQEQVKAERAALDDRALRRHELCLAEIKQLETNWRQLHEQIAASTVVVAEMQLSFDAERELLMMRVAQLDDANDRLRQQLDRSWQTSGELSDKLEAARVKSIGAE